MNEKAGELILTHRQQHHEVWRSSCSTPKTHRRIKMLTIFLIVVAVIAIVTAYPFIRQWLLLASMDEGCRNFALDMRDLKLAGKKGDRYDQYLQLTGHDKTEAGQLHERSESKKKGFDENEMAERLQGA